MNPGITNRTNPTAIARAEHTDQNDRPEPGEPVPIALTDLEVAAEEGPGGGARDRPRQDRPHQDRDGYEHERSQHPGDEASVDDDLHAVPKDLSSVRPSWIQRSVRSTSAMESGITITATIRMRFCQCRA